MYIRPCIVGNIENIIFWSVGKQSSVMALYGKVKWYNIQRGFGFITHNGTTNDYFIHRSNISTPNPDHWTPSLAKNEAVCFNVGEGGVAINVSGPEGVQLKGCKTAWKKPKLHMNRYALGCKFNLVSTTATTRTKIMSMFLFRGVIKIFYGIMANDNSDLFQLNFNNRNKSNISYSYKIHQAGLPVREGIFVPKQLTRTTIRLRKERMMICADSFETILEAIGMMNTVELVSVDLDFGDNHKMKYDIVPILFTHAQRALYFDLTYIPVNY